MHCPSHKKKITTLTFINRQNLVTPFPVQLSSPADLLAKSTENLQVIDVSMHAF